MEEQDEKLYCPHCGSSQLVANKKGFGLGKAVTGAVLTGGVGLLAGFIGSGNVKITCLKCGKTMKPGELLTKTAYEKKAEEKKAQEEAFKNPNSEQAASMAIVGLFIFALLLLMVYAIVQCS